ncbi:Neuroblastoma-amplified sequence [Trichoplax sp. H2]|nr:Neuroblastoma-amplified sequence [Trichoplax sp. H2]|eukprot:RDD46288.1 Neuroblastoma-amplified sequence [Trichoplax sp. H2]
MTTQDSSNCNTSILYDLFIQDEWHPEPILLKQSSAKANKDTNDASAVRNWSQIAFDQVKSTYKAITSTLRSRVTSSAVPSTVSNLINRQAEWKFAKNNDGRLIAILTDTCLELRSAKDDYSTVVATCAVHQDPFPRWRQIAWSPDSSLIACSYSSGDISIFDLSGTLLYTINRSKFGTDPTEKESRYDGAIAALLFIDYHQTSHWNSQLLAIDFQGQLQSYFISESSNYKECHTFSFLPYHPLGVSTAIFHQYHRILIIGGSTPSKSKNDQYDSPSNARGYGISCWRILDDAPHYKIINSEEFEINLNSPLSRITDVSRRFLKANKSDHQHTVHKISLSPNGSLLAVVQCSGCLSVWELPSLRMKAVWHIDEQPDVAAKGQDLSITNYNSETSLSSTSHSASGTYHSYDISKAILALDWWSETSLVLVRSSGAVTISAIESSLQNLLGSSPEYFQPGSHVIALSDGGFLILEDDCKAVYKKYAMTSFTDDTESIVDSESEEEASYNLNDDEEIQLSTYEKLTEKLRRVLYFLTESDSFLQQDKAPKVLKRTYRLLCLKSTTPEELYSRKIDQEEYGEALTLAESYGLDSNLVYKRRWQQSKMSIMAIQDFLSKITDRFWVLEECIQRVPIDIDAVKELLQYGLLGTNKAVFQAALNNTDFESSFIISTINNDDDDENFQKSDIIKPQRQQSTMDELSDEESVHNLEIKKLPDFSCLNEKAKKLYHYRLILLKYLDRLLLYEIILGGAHLAPERFSPIVFESFRSSNIIKITTEYARESNWEAVDILFAYFSTVLTPHRLAILSNFPETCSPKKYKYLLPELTTNDEVAALDTNRIRSEDWCEIAYGNGIESDIEEGIYFLYADCPHLKEFSHNLNSELLTAWYLNRATEIEFLSQQVSNAIDLIKLGMGKNIKNLEPLLNNLLTLEVMVYECGNVSITLKDILSMSNIEKVRLLLHKKGDSSYVSNFKCYVLPYLHRLEIYEPGSYDSVIRQYLIEEAKQDLSYCQLIFQHSKVGSTSPIIPNIFSAISIAADCIYAYCGNDQLDCAKTIVECLHVSSAITLDSVHSSILKELKNHVRTAEILHDSNLPSCISDIRKMINNAEESKALMMTFTRKATAGRISISASEWRSILNRMLTMVESSFTSITNSDCHEIFTDCLLHSSDINSISLAAEFLSSSQRQRSSKISYEKSVSLVLKAAQEYFDSSKDYSDRNTSYARKCLSLISVTTPEIEAEINLINSLSYLSDLGLFMLPLEIRLCENRLNLIRNALGANPKNYLKYEKLLKLGNLIQISAKDEVSRIGQILTVVAESAMEENDYDFAYKMCQNLMNDNHSNAWQICWRLAECNGFPNLSDRRRLIAFALTHCTADVIEKLLIVKSHIEIQELYYKINREIGTSKTPVENLRSNVFKTISNNLRLQDNVIKWISNPFSKEEHTKSYDSQLSDSSNDVNSKSLDKILYDTFYASTYGDNRISNNTIADLLAIDTDPSFTDSSVLRMEKLFESNQLGADFDQASDVFLSLASKYADNDTVLTLSYLLALPDRKMADKFFRQSNVVLNFKLAIYYYSLQIYFIMQKTGDSVDKRSVSFNPNEILKTVTNLIESPTSDGDDVTKSIVDELSKLLQYYQSALSDYVQAQILRNLGRGVDTARFAVDDEYKYDTILGLAMTLRDSVFKTAITLAERYSITHWDIYMAHTEWLLTDSGLAVSAIEDRINSMNILDFLTTDIEKARHRLENNVYPAIQGSDYGMLTFYFQFLNTLTDKNTPIEELTKVQDYQTVIIKMKSAAPGIDFKKLFDEDQPLVVLKPYLSSNNVHAVAKLAPKICNIQNSNRISASKIFLTYVKKVFWHGNKKTSSKPSTTSGWISRYQSAIDILKHLTPNDLVDYVKAILFQDESPEELSMDCRVKLIKRLIKLSTEQESKDPSTSNDDEATDSPDQDFARYSTATKLFAIILKHLTMLKESKTMQELAEKNADCLKYVRDFDMSLSSSKKVEELARDMIMKGIGIRYVKEMIGIARNCWPNQVTLFNVIKSAIETTITEMLDKCRSEKSLLANISSSSGSPIEALNTVLSGIISESSGKVDRSDVTDLLFSYCNSNTIEPQIRIQILDLIEKICTLENEEFQKILCFKSSVVIKEAWDEQITLEDVSTELGRYDLFQNLLNITSERTKILALAHLLHLWPKFCEISEDTQHPWIQVLEQIITSCGAECENDIIEIVKGYHLADDLDLTAWERLWTLFRQHSLIHVAVKTSLFTDYKPLHEKVINFIRSDEFPVNCCDDEELVRLIVRHRLEIEVLATPLFCKVTDYIRKHPNGDAGSRSKLEQLSRRLYDSGHYLEAGTLNLEYINIHPLLVNASNAITLLQRTETD